MQLLTPDVLKRLPHLYSQEKRGLKANAVIKFFMPDGSWTWYASEGSPVDDDGYYDTDKPKVDFIFFGLVDGFALELGYFALSDLIKIRGDLGLSVERDLGFQPITLLELMQQLRRSKV